MSLPRHALPPPPPPSRRALLAALLLALLVGLLCATSPLAAKETHLYGPYAARVGRIVDGDTVEMDVFLWPGLSQRIKLRLSGVNTPEKRGKGVSLCEKVAAKRASEFTRRFLRHVDLVTVSGVKLGKYAGRVLGKIAVNGKDLGEALITAGLARPYAGGPRAAWC